MKPLRRTKATLAVLGYLAEHTDNDVWGYVIARDVGLHHGTVYPLLHHVHEGGWSAAATRLSPNGGLEHRTGGATTYGAPITG